MEEITENITDDLKEACRVLQAGGLILYPTDTIWGIGCDATNEEAVRKVYELKQRADHKAMLALVDNPAKLNGYVDEVPDVAWDLIELSDKPLTIIYSNAKNLAPNLVGEDGSVGIRITHERFSHNLCERFRRPVVSTSANKSGEPAPSSYSDISQSIRDGADYIVRYRQTEQIQARPSGIVKVGRGGLIQVIRE